MGFLGKFGYYTRMASGLDSPGTLARTGRPLPRRQFLPCLGAAAAAGCGRRIAQRRTIRVTLTPRFTLAPMYLADEMGYFRQAGLEVEFHHAPDSVQMLPPLAAGRVDAGCQVPSPGFINAVLKGARLRIVASRDIAAPACGGGGNFFARRQAFPKGLADLRALKGKRVAVTSPTSFTAFLLDTLLASAGLTSADVTLSMMRLPDAMAALRAGAIDAVPAVTLDKDLDFASADVIRSFTLSRLLPNYQYSFITFGPSLLDSDPETGAGFLWAYLRGAADYLAGKTPRALEELARAAHSSPEAARRACRENISRDGKVDRDSVQRFADWAAGKGFIPRAVDASELIDTRFIERAHRRRPGLAQPAPG